MREFWTVSHLWGPGGEEESEAVEVTFSQQHAAMNYLTEIMAVDPWLTVEDSLVIEHYAGDRPTRSFDGLPPAKIHYVKSVVLGGDLEPRSDPYSDITLYFEHLSYSDPELFPALFTEGVYKELSFVYTSGGTVRAVLRAEGQDFSEVEEVFDDMIAKMRSGYPNGLEELRIKEIL